MNRMGLGLAVGAGYVLGRTKKMKLAFAIGTLVAGKRLKLSPQALAELLTQQLQNNPQVKEIGDELRQDLRGVGKAASGALVERQIQGLADRLHSRTAEVRGRLSDAAPDARDEDDGTKDEAGDEARAKEPEKAERAGETEEAGEKPRTSRSRAPARKTAAKRTAGKAAEKGSAQQTARRAAAKKPAGKAPATKQGSARTSARKTTRSRSAKGGDGDE